MKIILPLLILGLAAVTFFYFTSPLLEEFDGLRAERVGLETALDNATKLKERQDNLISRYNAIDPQALADLSQFLPNNIDNVRLIIDINDIAKKYGLIVRNPSIAREEADKAAPPPPTGETGNGAAGRSNTSAVMSFSVSSPYETMKVFLSDLVRSLRLVDIETMAFSSNDKNLYDYQISLRTFWLK